MQEEGPISWRPAGCTSQEVPLSYEAWCGLMDGGGRDIVTRILKRGEDCCCSSVWDSVGHGILNNLCSSLGNRLSRWQDKLPFVASCAIQVIKRFARDQERIMSPSILQTILISPANLLSVSGSRPLSISLLKVLLPLWNLSIHFPGSPQLAANTSPAVPGVNSIPFWKKIKHKKH